MSHFSNDGQATLCGLPVTGIILKQPRNPDCRVCSDAHAAKGWTFPLPDNVVSNDTPDTSGGAS
jgi:hypothetical protein